MNVLLMPVIFLKEGKDRKLQKSTIFLHLVSYFLAGSWRTLYLEIEVSGSFFNGIEGQNKWFSSFIAIGKRVQCNVKMKQQYKWKQKQL